MYMNLAPGAVGISVASLQELIALARRHGFGGVDLPRNQLADERDADEARQMIDQAGLRWGLFGMPMGLDAPAGEWQAGLRQLGRLAPLVARAGCTRTYDHVWSGHDERPYADNVRFHAKRLRQLADILCPLGITFGIEFLGPRTIQQRFRHPFVCRIEQAVELIDAAGCGVGLVLDLFHWYCSGGTVDELRRWLGAVEVVNVHANDAPAGVPHERQEDGQRALPGQTGVIDAAGAVAVLRELRYDGPIIAEPFQPEKARLAALDPDVAAAEVAASLRPLLDAFGRESTFADDGTGPAG